MVLFYPKDQIVVNHLNIFILQIYSRNKLLKVNIDDSIILYDLFFLR